MNNPPPAKLPEPGDRLLERVIIGGDLSGLTPMEKTRHYIRVCRSMGLNEVTQPFAYLKLQGKETLYALKACTDQLRSIHSISIEIISRELVDGIYTVRARSSDPTGRRDEDEGVVPLPDSVKGEFRSNLMMKATTKAKRRVTLSHCGLGFPDESEVETIRGAETIPPPSVEQLTMAEEMDDQIPDHELLEAQQHKEHADAARSASGSAAAAVDKETSPPTSAAAVNPPGVNVPAPRGEFELLWEQACQEARRGSDDLRKFYRKCKPAHKQYLVSRHDELVKLYPPIGE
jgi:hypothetical protein